MFIERTYKFRLYPSEPQIQKLHDWQSRLRYLWNRVNEVYLGAHNIKWLSPKERISIRYQASKDLTELKKDFEVFTQVPRVAQTKTIMRLEESWKRYTTKDQTGKRFGKPKFKRHFDAVSIYYQTQDWLTGSYLILQRRKQHRLRVPTLGYVDCVVHRPVVGNVSSCTITEEAGSWYASLRADTGRKTPDPKQTGTALALDMGVKFAASDSNGRHIQNPKFLAKSAQQLARAQQVVSRRYEEYKSRCKGLSKEQRITVTHRNLDKAKQRVAKLHAKIKHQRSDFWHKISYTYAGEEHKTIIVEALKIKNMTASASGTLDDPGTNVAQKRGLNKSILDVGWGQLFTLLGYKQVERGGELIKVNPAYSSQTCSQCMYVDAGNRLTQSEFKCVKCGYVSNADTNAAKVLLHRGTHGLSLRRVKSPVEAETGVREHPEHINQTNALLTVGARK